MVSSPVHLLQIGSLHIGIWDGWLSAEMLVLVIVLVLNNIFRVQNHLSVISQKRISNHPSMCTKMNLKCKSMGQGITTRLTLKYTVSMVC